MHMWLVSIRSDEYYISVSEALFALRTLGRAKLWKLIVGSDFKKLQKSNESTISISLATIRSCEHYGSSPEALFTPGTSGGAKPWKLAVTSNFKNLQKSN